MSAQPRGKVAILGAGRAGCSLHAALAQAHYAVLPLWSRSTATAHAAEEEGFPVVTGHLPAHLAEADVVVLAVSDGAVLPLARQLAEERALKPGALALHLSGALDLEVLEPLRFAGIRVGSLHPLYSIATRRTQLAGAAAAVAASDASAQDELEVMAQDVGLSIVRPTGDRARYHAAACIAGNFPQVLMEAGTRLLLASGLTRDDARRALGPLLTGAARNAALVGGAQALTGPVARGDLEVVERHLGALATQPEGERIERLYRAASLLAVELAKERGAGRLDEIEHILSDHLSR